MGWSSGAQGLGESRVAAHIPEKLTEEICQTCCCSCCSREADCHISCPRALRRGGCAQQSRGSNKAPPSPEQSLEGEATEDTGHTRSCMKQSEAALRGSPGASQIKQLNVGACSLMGGPLVEQSGAAQQAETCTEVRNDVGIWKGSHQHSRHTSTVWVLRVCPVFFFSYWGCCAWWHCLGVSLIAQTSREPQALHPQTRSDEGGKVVGLAEHPQPLPLATSAHSRGTVCVSLCQTNQHALPCSTNSGP